MGTVRRYLIEKRRPKARFYMPGQPKRPRITRSEIWPDAEDGYCAGSTSIIEEMRQPDITSTGVLDGRGVPYLRVELPIRVPMGFHIPRKEVEDDQESISFFIPADHVTVTDVTGGGISYADLSDVES